MTIRFQLLQSFKKTGQDISEKKNLVHGFQFVIKNKINNRSAAEAHFGLSHEQRLLCSFLMPQDIISVIIILLSVIIDHHILIPKEIYYCHYITLHSFLGIQT